MKLRLGLVELAPDTTGGAATYGRAMRAILSEVCGKLDFELVRLVNEANRHKISGLDASVVSYRKWAAPNLSRWATLLPRGLVVRRGGAQQDSLPEILVRERIDLVWFLAPNSVIEQVRDTPFVMTVWDLAHREVQGFPEFSSGKDWSRRESWYTQNIGRAFHVATDSLYTGKYLERIYGLYPQNWSPVGLPLPAEVDIDMSLADTLTRPYFYYPASFWPHKNHKVLIDALALLDETQSCLVFTGTDEGMEDRLKLYALAKGLEERVMFLGRVTDAEVQGLISGASAIVMPSMLGPTNYPPLEGLKLGTPALVSTAHHFDDIPEGYFSVLDPHDSLRWAEGMEQLLTSVSVLPVRTDLNIASRDKVESILRVFRESQEVFRFP